MRHVPYRGNNFALSDVTGGHISGMVSTTGQLVPQHKAGHIRILAVTARARLPELAIIDIGLNDEPEGGFALCRELRALSPAHPVLAKVGSGTLVTEWEKARHEIPMGSLNKATSEEELRAWLARCDELLAPEGLVVLQVITFPDQPCPAMPAAMAPKRCEKLGRVENT